MSQRQNGTRLRCVCGQVRYKVCEGMGGQHSTGKQSNAGKQQCMRKRSGMEKRRAPSVRRAVDLRPRDVYGGDKLKPRGHEGDSDS